MENNNNGRGIFYGVIGVATLVVAIIGATFAYFSATTGRNDVLNVASTSVDLNIIGEEFNILTDLIPVETEGGAGNVDKNNVTLFAAYPGLDRPVRTGDKSGWTIGKGTCTDDEGNSICGVYQFTIENPSDNVSQNVTGGIKILNNGGFTNLSYAVFKGAADSITSFNVNAQAKAVGSASVGDVVVGRTAFPNVTQQADFTMWANTNETLAPNGTTTYTVVVWLEEAGEANQSEQGIAFSAAITFTTGTGTGVTGVLTATS